MPEEILKDSVLVCKHCGGVLSEYTGVCAYCNRIDYEVEKMIREKDRLKNLEKRKIFGFQPEMEDVGL